MPEQDTPPAVTPTDRLLLSLTARSLYPHILSWFAEIPRVKRAVLRVVDVPSGNGVLSVPLAAAGFSVTPIDLFPETLARSVAKHGQFGVVESFRQITRVTMPAFLRRALFGSAEADPEYPRSITALGGDMEGALPVESKGADIVVCIEGIEHVMDRHKTLHEFRRLLRPGGRLLISTPNLLSLRARLAYACTGQRAFHSYIDEFTSVWGRSPDGTRTYHGHAFLISYFQLRYSLHHCGFKVKRVLPSNWSPTSMLLLPLVPVVWLSTLLAQRPARARLERMRAAGSAPANAQPPYSEMMRHLLSPSMLLNATLILEAEAV